MKYASNKLFVFSLLLIVMGGSFITIEQIFYQYVDENRVLHESIFLPLGLLSIAIGTVLLLLFIARQIRDKLNKSS